jgi:VCBS repeat-containing protein
MTITFNNTYLSGITSLSADFQTSFNNVVLAVESFFNQQFSDNVTLNVSFDWQALNPGWVSGGFFLGSNNFTQFPVSYTDIINALSASQSTNDANPGDDAAAIAALPGSDPAPTTDSNTVRYLVTQGEEKLLGLNGVGPNDNLGADATITLASDLPVGNFDFDRSDGIGANSFDLFAVIAHEISEGLMGRIMSGGGVSADMTNDYTIMDLFHFTAAGVRAMLETGANNLFSFSGTTGDPNLNRVLDNSGDIADPSSFADPQNSFADAVLGVLAAITQTDLRILDVLGWTRISGLDDHNQSDTSATTVLNDDVNGISGNLELQGDHDWFKVTLSSDKHYVIKIEGADTGEGTLADPFLALYAGAGASRDTSATFMTDNNSGTGQNAQASIGFGNGGTYFVDVGSILNSIQDIGTGTYRVTLIGNTPPTLSTDSGSPHALTEISSVTNSAILDQASGTLSFTDPDVTDTHTASASLFSAAWSDGVTIPASSLTALGSAMSDSISVDATSGTLAWQFGVADRNVDFLAVNETLTLIYDVTVADHRTGSPISDSDTQQVTIVFTGTNDAVVVDAAGSVLTGSVAEMPNVTGSSATDSTSGTVAFIDPDLNDRPTASIDAAGQTVTWQDATQDFTSELTGAQIGDLVGAFSIVAAIGNTNSGHIDWSYDIVDQAIDFLGAGESVTVTTPVVIDDHNGSTVTSDVVATVYGANDAPEVLADSNGTAKHSTLTVASAGVLANDSDPDAHDQLFVSEVDGASGNVGNPVAGTYGALTLNADGSYVYVANNGQLPSKIVAQDTFDYAVSDGNGGTDTTTLSIVVFNPGAEYQAGANTTLTGGNGPDVLDGSAGNNVLIGGNGPDVLIAGDGNMMTGGGGPDIFLFRPDFGINTILDLNLNNDALQFDSSIFADVDDLLLHTSDTAAGAVIDDGNGNEVALPGVTLAEMQGHTSDFYLV